MNGPINFAPFSSLQTKKLTSQPKHTFQGQFKMHDLVFNIISTRANPAPISPSNSTVSHGVEGRIGEHPSSNQTYQQLDRSSELGGVRGAVGGIAPPVICVDNASLGNRTEENSLSDLSLGNQGQNMVVHRGPPNLSAGPLGEGGVNTRCEQETPAGGGPCGRGTMPRVIQAHNACGPPTGGGETHSNGNSKT